MLETELSEKEDKDTGRLESFSDGVFALAMTLLVVELKVPSFVGTPTPHQLWVELGKQWPSYFAFTTSFFTVLIMWVNHHGIFRLIRKSSAMLLFANGVLLFLVTLVPFPTALVAKFLQTPAAGMACATYAGTFVFISISYSMVLVAAKRGGKLLVDGAMPEVRRRLRDCYLVGTPLYSAAFVASAFSAWLSLAICTALWIFWTIGSLEQCTAFER